VTRHFDPWRLRSPDQASAAFLPVPNQTLGNSMPPAILDDDESHPIPHLGKIDVAVDLKNGAYYGIVISKPLNDDSVTRARLLRKLDNYFNDFQLKAFKKRIGTAFPGKLRIYVKLPPGSDAGIFDFLKTCRLRLADNLVELRIGIDDLP
jgi:hypothetical protein